MEHRKHKEEKHLLHEEFVREACKGFKALEDVQKDISGKLGKYVHLSNIAIAYEGSSSGLINFSESRKSLIERVKKILLENPKYISTLDEVRATVYHSNFHCGLHGRR